MTYQTVRKLLQRIRHVQRRLIGLYSAAASGPGRSRVDELFSQIERYEAQAERCIARYERTGSQPVLDSWIAFPPDLDDCLSLDRFVRAGDTSLETIVQAAIRVDDCLIRVFRTLGEVSRSEGVRGLFANLADLQAHKRSQIARAALEVDLHA